MAMLDYAHSLKLIIKQNTSRSVSKDSFGRKICLVDSFAFVKIKNAKRKKKYGSSPPNKRKKYERNGKSSNGEIHSNGAFSDHHKGEAFDTDDSFRSAQDQLPNYPCEEESSPTEDQKMVLPSQSLNSVERIFPDWMYVCIDCEMVGTGEKGRHSALARCTILDYEGNVVYDRYILPKEAITDYRTLYSGIRPVHMKSATQTDIALKEIHDILANKIIIGHSVYHDFRVLHMTPEFFKVRDTSQCRILVDKAGLGKCCALKKLSAALLDRHIQGQSGHCSAEDALATLDLFKMVRKEWEPELYRKWLKKDERILEKLAEMADVTHFGPSVAVNYLDDKFWPQEVLT